jgi:hypothetical protein
MVIVVSIPFKACSFSQERELLSGRFSIKRGQYVLPQPLSFFWTNW